jgi:phospholipid/cholesterol/gamma-HCH transport system substrate-binding protein
MENKSNAFFAGVFTLGLLALVVIAVMWFRQDQTVRVPYDLVTRSTINGLSPQAAVKYRGLDVGKVETIKFDPDMPGQIIVRIMVNKDAPITETTYATLGFQGVTGLSYIQLDDQTLADSSGTVPPKSAPLKTSPSNVAKIYMRPGFFEELERRGDRMLAEAERLMGSINSMFSTENREQLMGAVASFEETMAAYRKTVQAVDPALQKLPQAIDNLNGTLASTRRLADQLANPDGTLQRTIDTVGRDMQVAADAVQSAASGISQETLPQINRFAREARQTARSLDRTVNEFGRRPQSLLFGADAVMPGPGEAGFAAP